jgi:uncharacterized metal-binding protein YceD (DUF177 family)
MRPAAEPDALVVDISAMRRRRESHASIERELAVGWLREALSDTDAEVEAPAHVELQLVVQGDGSVIVTGTLRGEIRVPCARCLDLADVSADSAITALYVREGAARSLPDRPSAGRDDEDLGDDEDGDEDLWPFDGVHLDLRPMLVETVKLAYPMRVLCTRGQDCRGLCSQCGAPLNEQPADASKCTACGAADPRVPEVDLAPTAEEPRTDALAEALRKVRIPE